MNPSLQNQIQESLESNDLDAVAGLAKTNRRVISLLVRKAYDKETLVGWRAIKAVGVAAQKLIQTDYEFLRETIRKLRWSLSDESGGIGWAAPELIGEIVCADAQHFLDIIPLIAEAYELEEDVFRPGVIYALSRIADKTPELVAPYSDVLFRAMQDKSPMTRIYALQLLGKMKSLLKSCLSKAIDEQLQLLKSDVSEAWIYDGEKFANVVVGQAAVVTRNLYKPLLK